MEGAQRLRGTGRRGKAGGGRQPRNAMFHARALNTLLLGISIANLIAALAVVAVFGHRGYFDELRDFSIESSYADIALCVIGYAVVRLGASLSFHIFRGRFFYAQVIIAFLECALIAFASYKLAAWPASKPPLFLAVLAIAIVFPAMFIIEAILFYCCLKHAPIAPERRPLLANDIEIARPSSLTMASNDAFSPTSDEGGYQQQQHMRKKRNGKHAAPPKINTTTFRASSTANNIGDSSAQARTSTDSFYASFTRGSGVDQDATEIDMPSQRSNRQHGNTPAQESTGSTLTTSTTATTQAMSMATKSARADADVVGTNDVIDAREKVGVGAEEAGEERQADNDDYIQLTHENEYEVVESDAQHGEGSSETLELLEKDANHAEEVWEDETVSLKGSVRSVDVGVAEPDTAGTTSHGRSKGAEEAKRAGKTRPEAAVPVVMRIQQPVQVQLRPNSLILQNKPKVPTAHENETREEKTFRKRMLIVDEIVATEESFVTTLHMLVDVFLTPLKTMTVSVDKRASTGSVLASAEDERDGLAEGGVDAHKEGASDNAESEQPATSDDVGDDAEGEDGGQDQSMRATVARPMSTMSAMSTATVGSYSSATPRRSSKDGGTTGNAKRTSGGDSRSLKSSDSRSKRGSGIHHQPIISEKDLKTIFLEVETLVKINGLLLEELHQRYASWDKDTQIGDVFLKFLPFLKHFKTYATNFDTALATIQKCRTSEIFQKFLTDCRLNPRCEKLWLEDHMITPIQRVPRYRLLLQDLVAKTPSSHPDSANLIKALDEVKKLATEINTTKAESENSLSLIDVQRKVKYCPEIVLPSRKLLTEVEAVEMDLCALPDASGSDDGRLRFKHLKQVFTEVRPVVLYLFNDMVLLAQHQRVGTLFGKFKVTTKKYFQQTKHKQPVTVEEGRTVVHKYKFIRSASLLDVVAKAYDDEPALVNSDGDDCGFTIYFPTSSDEFYFLAPSAADRDRFVAAFEAARKDYEAVTSTLPQERFSEHTWKPIAYENKKMVQGRVKGKGSNTSLTAHGGNQHHGDADREGDGERDGNGDGNGNGNDPASDDDEVDADRVGNLVSAGKGSRLMTLRRKGDRAKSSVATNAGKKDTGTGTGTGSTELPSLAERSQGDGSEVSMNGKTFRLLKGLSGLDEVSVLDEEATDGDRNQEKDEDEVNNEDDNENEDEVEAQAEENVEKETLEEEDEGGEEEKRERAEDEDEDEGKLKGKDEADVVISHDGDDVRAIASEEPEASTIDSQQQQTQQTQQTQKSTGSGSGSSSSKKKRKKNKKKGRK